MALSQTFNQDVNGNIGIAGSVSTSAPTYTTGTTSPLSLTTTGLLRVDGSGVTQPISASSLPLPTGASTSALQTSGNASLTTIAGGVLSQGSTTVGQSGELVLGAVTTASPTYTTGQSSAISLTVAGALRTDSSSTTQPISAAALPLPTGAATSALQTSGNTTLSAISAQLPVALGPQSSSGSLSVVQATGTTFSVSQTTSATANLTSVANSLTSVTVLASNSSRKGFVVYNDSIVILYLAFGATASTTAFSYKLQPATAYTSDTLYTGVISGIASAASGSARVTEFV